ncbi:hypothetical protein FA15DRAFT_102942 [Coprinopsis marcescibilis]|uniref:Uncharacterized protein n=1 Tax=Coprinopsis marcescibilis TaxID=230819 RepID=A0A5C3KL76_COPMA|nr:hypothetical protein FA15DRAFT_102942 [Coprinopsis marcescibilis]
MHSLFWVFRGLFVIEGQVTHDVSHPRYNRRRRAATAYILGQDQLRHHYAFHTNDDGIIDTPQSFLRQPSNAYASMLLSLLTLRLQDYPAPAYGFSILGHPRGYSMLPSSAHSHRAHATSLPSMRHHTPRHINTIVRALSCLRCITRRHIASSYWRRLRQKKGFSFLQPMITTTPSIYLLSLLAML